MTRKISIKTDSLLKTPKKTKLESNESPFVTPPKQKKLQDDENVIKQSPSTLLNQLKLDSPKNGKGKRLFDDDIYQNARKALHSAPPPNLPGRETELANLMEFVQKHLNEEKSGSVYISGPPGTGKTATLNLILQKNQIQKQCEQIYINCTGIKSSAAIFARIAIDLNLKTGGKNEKINIKSIENHLRKSDKMLLLILDEIDQLESKNQSILYRIFEWPIQLDTKLILIGIANALDLTDRILPRLQLRCELKPVLMHFAPYTKQQIIEIFTARLREADVMGVFTPAAVQMLAGKVAAVSGDVRRALDIGRRVVEMIAHDRDDVLKSVENLIENETKTVGLKQVVDVLNNVYGTAQNMHRVADDDDGAVMPLQQKIVICSLLLIRKQSKNKDVRVDKLHNIYRKICLKRNVSSVDQSEFVGLCSLIETRGILRIVKKKEARLSKIVLEWDEEEIYAVLKDEQLISSILNEL